MTISVFEFEVHFYMAKAPKIITKPKNDSTEVFLTKMLEKIDFLRFIFIFYKSFWISMAEIHCHTFTRR